MKLYFFRSFAAVVLGAMSAAGEDVGCANELGWTDTFGDGCEKYDAIEELCILFGDIAGDFGMTPKDVCCICKATVVEDCDNEPGWTDVDGDGCEWYELYEEPGCPMYGWAGASETCCHCGGGGDPSNEVPPSTPSTGTCTDEQGWTDFAGDGCDWYELHEEPGCPLNGYFTGASEACCHCGGGCTDEPGWVDSLGDGCSYYEAFEFPGCPLEGNFADANGLEAWDACCHCKVA